MTYRRYATYRDALEKRGGWEVCIIAGKTYYKTGWVDFRPQEIGEWTWAIAPDKPGETHAVAHWNAGTSTGTCKYCA